MQKTFKLLIVVFTSAILATIFLVEEKYLTDKGHTPGIRFREFMLVDSLIVEFPMLSDSDGINIHNADLKKYLVVKIAAAHNKHNSRIIYIFLMP